MRRRCAGPWLALAAWVAVASLPVSAERLGGTGGDGRFGKGRFRIGLDVGYAIPFGFRSSIGDSEYVVLQPRVSVGVSRVLGENSLYRGAFELGAEGLFMFQTRPQGGTAHGITALLRYNVLYWNRVVPFYEIGAGLLDLEFGLEDRSDGFNFTLHNGAGVHWLAWDRAALTAQFRWNHVSNAGIELPNDALDSAVFLVGMTYFLR